MCNSFVKTENIPVLTPVQFQKKTKKNIHTLLLLHIFHKTYVCIIYTFKYATH